MPSIPFSKFHGFGNDYIVIERNDIPGEVELGKLAAAICQRNQGVGSDGIAVLSEETGVSADYLCEIVNPDGSIAGFSGNGTRCAVAYLYHKKLRTEPNVRLATRSGVKNYTLLEQPSDTEFWFEAEIGKPKFASEDVPVLVDVRRDHIVNEPIESNGRHYTISTVNVGNPVACLFVEKFDFDWRVLGRELEYHPRFPDRANIVFVRVEDRENIEIRIWERGAGETSASGTCASGSAVLSAFLLKTGREVKVTSPGGMTNVVWRADDDEIVITGRADLAFSGAWPY